MALHDAANKDGSRHVNWDNSVSASQTFNLMQTQNDCIYS